MITIKKIYHRDYYGTITHFYSIFNEYNEVLCIETAGQYYIEFIYKFSLEELYGIIKEIDDFDFDWKYRSEFSGEINILENFEFNKLTDIKSLIKTNPEIFI